MDLIVKRAQLPDRPIGSFVDVGVEGGRIVAIEADLGSEAATYDAEGCLVCGGFVETHIHLDKTRLLDKRPALPGRRIAAVPYTSSVKPSITCEDVYERGERSLCNCILHGTTRIRSHVEVDPAIGMRGFDAVQQLAKDYAWAVDLELCVFPQDGLTNKPGTDELLIEGLRRGAKLIGAAPRYDTDGAAQIHRIFEIAREYDVDIDMHLDAGDSTPHLDVHLVIELTETFKLGGRVTVGHMAKLSLLPVDEVAAIAKRLADAGVNVTVLPATDLFLMARDYDHAVPRGVADANFLLSQGVQCSLSSNNILNPSTPYGDCSLVRMANLHANLLQVGVTDELCRCFEMITSRSAAILNHGDYGVAVGNPADLAIIDSTSPDRAVAEIGRPLAVFKKGRQTVHWDRARLLRPA